jgi:hypothetical protein
MRPGLFEQPGVSNTPLPELDLALPDRVIPVADRRQGKPMSASVGPLRITVPGEKRHSRWVRQVIAINVCKA